jgi:hypothetical protein
MRRSVPGISGVQALDSAGCERFRGERHTARHPGVPATKPTQPSKSSEAQDMLQKNCLRTVVIAEDGQPLVKALVRWGTGTSGKGQACKDRSMCGASHTFCMIRRMCEREENAPVALAGECRRLPPLLPIPRLQPHFVCGPVAAEPTAICSLNQTQPSYEITKLSRNVDAAQPGPAAKMRGLAGSGG